MTEKELQLSIENVCFSSDGKNELYVNLECVGDTLSDYSGVNVDLYHGDKWIGSEWCDYRCRVKVDTRDLKLQSGQTNIVPITIEARRPDNDWDGTQDVKKYPLVASKIVEVAIYHERRIFKNVIEIR